MVPDTRHQLHISSNRNIFSSNYIFNHLGDISPNSRHMSYLVKWTSIHLQIYLTWFYHRLWFYAKLSELVLFSDGMCFSKQRKYMYRRGLNVKLVLCTTAPQSDADQLAKISNFWTVLSVSSCYQNLKFKPMNQLYTKYRMVVKFLFLVCF